VLLTPPDKLLTIFYWVQLLRVTSIITFTHFNGLNKVGQNLSTLGLVLNPVGQNPNPVGQKFTLPLFQKIRNYSHCANHRSGRRLRKVWFSGRKIYVYSSASENAVTKEC